MGTGALVPAGTELSALASFYQMGTQAQHCQSSNFFAREIGKNKFCFLMCRFSILKHWQQIQVCFFFKYYVGQTKYICKPNLTQTMGLQFLKFCVMVKAMESVWVQTPVLPSAVG